jgi:glutamate-ammonia-ligase adenylyltransferase
VATEYKKLVAKWGEPTIFESGEPGAEGAATIATSPGRKCPLMVVALGKFGGREINYYSDLDVIFLYEAEGTTVQTRRSKRDDVTTNQHFFSELGQRIIKVATNLGPFGRLYQIDPRLRPTGRSGPLATSLSEFAKYFASGQGQLWERQALCKARLVVCPPEARPLAIATLHDAAFAPGWQASDLETVHAMRGRMERSAPSGNLKRGPGGLADIEFLVQSLQLKHGHDDLSLRVAGTFEALAALHAAGHLSRDDYEFFNDSYRFLRTLQARLRLMTPVTRDTLPEDPHDLARLAGLLGYGSAATLLSDCQHITAENRRRFERLFEGVAA